MSDRLLNVFLDDMPVGTLEQNRHGGMAFTYGPGFLARATTGISLNLPLQEEAFADDSVKAFFSGLLPDGVVRERLAQHFGVSHQNTFALLEAVGGDCAGALSLYPQGQEPAKTAGTRAEFLDEQTLAEMLDLLHRRPFLVGEADMRLSLAGAQDKLPIVYEQGNIGLAKGQTPSTHILKPMIERVADSVYNELFCMRLAQAMGMDAPDSFLQHVGNQPCYIVQRYDRRQEDGRTKRIHQEDFCQALGRLPEIKYENEGGANVADCQNILLNHSARPAADQIGFLQMLIFNYLIGNADAHGKNFSLFYDKGLFGGHKPRLAPAYDLLCTGVYPGLSSKMAMKLGGEYRPDHVMLRHWHRLVPETKAAKGNLEKQLKQSAGDIVRHADALKTALQADGMRSPVFDEICALIAKRSRKISNIFNIL